MQQHAQALTKEAITKTSQSLDLNQLVQIFSCSLWLDSRLLLPDYFSLEKKKGEKKGLIQWWGDGTAEHRVLQFPQEFFWVSECPAVNKNNQRLLLLPILKYRMLLTYRILLPILIGCLLGEWSLGDAPWTLLTVVVINEYPGLLAPSNCFCSESWRDFVTPWRVGLWGLFHVFCSSEEAAVGGQGRHWGCAGSSFTHKLFMVITGFSILVSWSFSTSKNLPVSSS